MFQRYRLDGKIPVPCDNDQEFFLSFSADRHVGDDTINGVRVSTVFLGTDHQMTGNGPPILFETMLFGWSEDVCERYSTWADAEAGHKRWCFTLSDLDASTK